MKRTHLWPAAVALSFHAFLLFAFRSPPRVISDDKPVAPPTEETVVAVVPPLEDEPIEANGGSSAPAPARDVPRRPEPMAIRTEVSDIVIEAPPTRPRADLVVDAVPSNLVNTWGGEGGGGVGPGTSIIDVRGLDNEPRARVQPAPVYPFEQKRTGMSGTVTVRFTVDREGNVREAHVVQSDDRGFEESAVKAVLRWKFEPGRKNGRAVAFRMSVPIVFNINDAE
ncbi:MAG TPA: TonB family protein [Candidatus Synoicihabitans sp.]|nr:TonB family protein [Candidatus Synoicihabitans sp.]